MRKIPIYGHFSARNECPEGPVSTVGPEDRTVVIWVHIWVPLTKLPSVPMMGAVRGNFDFYGMIVEDPYLGRTPGPGVRVLPLVAVLREHRNTEKHLSQCPQTTILSPLW